MRHYMLHATWIQLHFDIKGLSTLNAHSIRIGFEPDWVRFFFQCALDVSASIHNALKPDPRIFHDRALLLKYCILINAHPD